MAFIVLVNKRSLQFYHFVFCIVFIILLYFMVLYLLSSFFNLILFSVSGETDLVMYCELWVKCIVTSLAWTQAQKNKRK